MSLPKFARADIEKKTLKILRPGTWVAPEVRMIDFDGTPAVLKDWYGLSLPVRMTVGWPLTKVETRILKYLIGLDGVPQILATVDRNAFVMSMLEGKALYKVPPADIPAGTFDRLLALVDAMHARGVVHLDLRQRKNVLLTPQGQPAIIDFASSLHFSKNGKVFNFLKGVDRSAILKLKNRVVPAQMTEEEKEALRGFNKMRRFWVIKRRRGNKKDEIT